MKNKYICLLAVLFLIAQPSFAMHIMEGYLPFKHCLIWYAVSLPFVVLSFRYVARLVRRDPKQKITLALAGAYVFLLSALKLPSVTGSSSHLTGTTLGTVITGPMSLPVIGLIVLLFQALLLAHGGISTLGANIFSLSIAGPFVAYGIYKGLGSLRVNRNVNVFLATFIGSLSTYLTTSFQLAFAYPDPQYGIWASAMKFMSIFAVTQVPLSLIEGFLTVLIFNILVKQGITPLHLMANKNEVR
ncbi:energy-coupling factor ABC transporter permease [Porphyromonas pogonae]|uniref:energy-coupling factor ABC transporter permease n=1 Tax=Porphyromonas pogonae TaxID=867595 RepID=UPI002E7A65F3|nr:energy-coupling factor ABC transporter permease [Porphyromonas pogonae]